MGLDVVELVMRCEEVFAIELHDEDMERVQTVGDLYAAVCKELRFAPCVAPTLEAGKNRLPQKVLNLEPDVWNAEDTWATLVAIFVDQLAVDEEEVVPSADIANDLRAD
jgi:acyl carrier protein